MSKKSVSKNDPIQKKVMEKISSGQIKMRPKVYYSLVGLLTAAATALLSFVAMYFVSVWSFWLRISLSNGPAFGAKRNLALLLSSFPWWALVLGGFALAGTVYIVKNTGKLYKIKLGYLIFIVVATFLLIGFVLSYSGLPRLMNGHNPVNESGTSGWRGRFMK